jgi:6-phosphogluconolactonase (cycloisomerase 2 family)
MAALASLAAESHRLGASVTRTNSIVPPRFAYVASIGATHSIRVYEIGISQWHLRQIIPSESPVTVALHPSGNTLYALNALREYQGLPCGSVQAFRVERETGHLTLLGRQSLSLSATQPSQLAVAADGSSLVVAIDGGGAYNSMPLMPNGQLMRVSGILKETGSGPVTAHQSSARPQAVLFDSSGKRIISTDLGADRVNVLSLEDGLLIEDRQSTSPGSGPQQLALHPGGHLLYIAHSLDGSLACHRYNEATGKLSGRVFELHSAFPTAIAMHPSGRFLHTAASGKITSWHVDPDSGALRETGLFDAGIGNPQDQTVEGLLHLADGSRLLAWGNEDGFGGIVQMRVNPTTGSLSSPQLVATLSGTRAIAIQ